MNIDLNALIECSILSACVHTVASTKFAVVIVCVLWQQIKTTERIEKLLVDEYRDALKHTSPLLFITSKEIDPEAMPPVPNNGRNISYRCAVKDSHWPYQKRMNSLRADFSKLCKKLQLTMISQLERLRDIVNNPDVSPRKGPYPFTSFTKKFREELRELMG